MYRRRRFGGVASCFVRVLDILAMLVLVAWLAFGALGFDSRKSGNPEFVCFLIASPRGDFLRVTSYGGVGDDDSTMIGV